MISYLQIDGLTKSFGDLVLFEDITFGIAQGQKVGLIAKNGTGKTTLLNIIAGKEDYDSGAVVFRNDLRVGYLEQTPVYPEGLTVLQACFYSPNETVRLIAEYEEAMASDDHSNLQDILMRMDNLKAWDYEQRAKQILSQLKITNFDQKGIHEKLYPLNVSVVIGVGVNISRIFFDFRYEQGIGNISKSIVYDNINSDGSTGVSPIIFRRCDSALSFSFGFIL